MEMDIRLYEILKGREEIYRTKVSLAEGGGVLSIALNIPGPEKRPLWGLELLQKFVQDFYEFLKAKHIDLGGFEIISNGAGNTAVMRLNEEDDFVSFKNYAVAFEDAHFAGRLFDIDIMARNIGIISRQSLGLPERKCFLCDCPAWMCIGKKHKPSELYEFYHGLAKKYLGSGGI